MDYLTEHYGGARAAALTSNGYQLSPPGGFPGACRFYKLTPDANRTVIMPRGDLCRNGNSVVVWNASPTFNITLLDQSGATLWTLVPGKVVDTFQIGQSVNGTWHFAERTHLASSTPQTLNRMLFSVHFGSDDLTVDLRRYFNTLRGYDGLTPAAITVTIGSPQQSCVIGANIGAENETALDTGDWPAGSTLLLLNWGVITGMGGDGGRGGDVPPGLLAQPGGNGTTGLRCRIPTAIVNYGRIAGGGGGGGGSAWNGALAAGSGGGGGAGHVSSKGGQPGSGGGGQEGVGGGVNTSGGPGNWNGANPGGYGGQAGAAGQSAPSGAAGGQPGAAIMRLSSVTVTKIVAGTISGAEGTF